jgi:GT2 family glycosyltransferase
MSEWTHTGRLGVSVVICAYTEARWPELVSAVRSVQAQTVPAQEIVLVIDHNDRLLARARSEIDGARVIENVETRGLSGARNSGIRVASGAVIAFLDDDAAAEPDWLAQLVGAYADPRVMGAGGAIVPRWEASRPAWMPRELDWVVGCTYRGMPEATAPVRNLIGCNMSFRREVFEMVGGFRSVLGRVGTKPVGCEETELCIRLLQHDPTARLIFEPSAAVRHLVPAGRGTWKYFAARCYAEGQSKAVMSRLVGTGDGLSSERAYVVRTLPRGVLGGLLDTLVRAKASGLGRAAAIVAGLGMTAAGYAHGNLVRTTDATGAQPSAPTLLAPVAAGSFVSAAPRTAGRDIQVAMPETPVLTV